MPIRTRDEMRRAIQAGVPQAPAAPQLSEREIYMNRMRARTGGALPGSAYFGRPEGTPAVLNGQKVQWEQTPGGGGKWVPFLTEGQMARGMTSAPAVPTLGSSQPPIQQSVAYGRPAAAARTEAANALLQQHGGGPAAGNLSRPLVPSEAEAMAGPAEAFHKELAANPLAQAPASIDPRDPAYAQRTASSGADISGWLKAMQGGSASDRAIAERFLAKQRQGEPQALRQSDGGLEAAYGGQIQVAPQGADLPGVAFKEGELPSGAPQSLGAAGMVQAFGQDMNLGPAPSAPAYQGPAPDRAPAGMGQGTEALQQAFSGELEVAPQGTAQQSNLNFNSPLPAANMSQAFEDARKKQLLNNPILGKYLNAASGFNQSFRP